MSSRQNPPFELKGFQIWGTQDDPFETRTGPFFYKKDDNGQYLSAFMPHPNHMNGAGLLHGGMLMSFADYAIFVIALTHLKNDDAAVTVSCHTDFVRGMAPATPVYANGEVTRATTNLLFIRGRIFVPENKTEIMLASFSGILKRFKPKSQMT